MIRCSASEEPELAWCRTRRRRMAARVSDLHEETPMDADRQAVSATGSIEEPGESATADRNDLMIVRDVSKQFGGTQALSDVSMHLKAGEILALLGENGAGKSTLIKILAGVYALDQGSVTFRGADVTGSPRHPPIASIHH